MKSAGQGLICFVLNEIGQASGTHAWRYVERPSLEGAEMNRAAGGKSKGLEGAEMKSAVL